jgi:hypothetical protein
MYTYIQSFEDKLYLIKFYEANRKKNLILINKIKLTISLTGTAIKKQIEIIRSDNKK